MNRRDLLKVRASLSGSTAGVCGVGVHAYRQRLTRTCPTRRSITRTASSSARDGGLYFCDVDNQLRSPVRLQVDARREQLPATGSEPTAVTADPATAASLNMPHEIVFDSRGHMYIAERDSHVVRRSTAKRASFRRSPVQASPGSPATLDQRRRRSLRQPHSIYLARTTGC